MDAYERSVSSDQIFKPEIDALRELSIGSQIAYGHCVALKTTPSKNSEKYLSDLGYADWEEYAHTHYVPVEDAQERALSVPDEFINCFGEAMDVHTFVYCETYAYPIFYREQWSDAPRPLLAYSKILSEGPLENYLKLCAEYEINSL